MPDRAGQAIARKAGFSEAVGAAIHDVHEHWDGHGHPRGTSREAIDPRARIVAVADIYEALTADRSYRPAMPVDAALAILRAEAGEHLAADVVEALARTLD